MDTYFTLFATFHAMFWIIHFLNLSNNNMDDTVTTRKNGQKLMIQFKKIVIINEAT